MSASSISSLHEISPLRHLSLVFPNPDPSSSHPISISLLDSPNPPSSPHTAALLVPSDRRHDWLFSSLSGHLHLLLSSPFPLSRLLLVSSPDQTLDQHLILPLLLALSPKSAFAHGRIPHVPFLSFQDDVVASLVLETSLCPFAGEVLVEDVRLSQNEQRRRMRFKNMPNLVQTQVRLDTDEKGESVPVVGCLVQPYLGPMVAALSLIGPVLRPRPRVLCLGVGGGALLMCLRSKLGAWVIGVEQDEVVLSMAKKYFGLVEDEFLRVCIGDAVRVVKLLSGLKGDKCSGRKCGGLERRVLETLGGSFDGFDAVMVDLDSGDIMTGACAPPPEIVRRDVLLALLAVLCEHGILIMNVVPSEKGFVEKLVPCFLQVFAEVYELDVGNEENFVLIATVSKIETTCSSNLFNERLKEVVEMRHLNEIKRI